jgi:hypothetical protein
VELAFPGCYSRRWLPISMKLAPKRVSVWF